MLGRIRLALERSRELKQLERDTQILPRPDPCELARLDSQKAVWRVPVPGQADRFMSASSGGINQEMFVVQVDTEALYKSWLSGSPAVRQKRSDDCVPRSKMPADYKYKHAVDGFAQGEKNPVPLADAGVYHKGKAVHVGFANGITRTFWLIANRVPAFPILVHGLESANLLHKVAGLGVGPKSLAELFAPAQRQSEQPITPEPPADIVRPVASKAQPRPARPGPRRGRSL
ncbi:hypothetical protein R69658_05988 [Paraburkholderia aspalathi]|uniref:Uncharacterized protein n=1 Tax=Paraburkholderia aspalathi TaxID=1324617 RepID=A0ABM8SPC8_9BURK|nr:hypothetical protein R69658_05988 [Paraburkholderia aspalathi]